jgi:hypothetical protein
MSSLHHLLFVGLASCAVTDVELTTQDIHGTGAALASQFQADRAIDNAGCTATRISAQWGLTAVHCLMSEDMQVMFYSNPSGHDFNLTGNIAQVVPRPGVDAMACLTNNQCNDTSGVFSDLVLLRFRNTVSGTTDSLDAPQATLEWQFPADGTAGKIVGGGRHNGADNFVAKLMQITDTIDGGEDNGAFYTNTDVSEPGDSGGPFYVGDRVVGVIRGQLPGSATKFTSVPRHLDWILATIGYKWSGTPSHLGLVYNGTLMQSVVATERICQYACDKTQSCEAYNYFSGNHSCGLYTAVTGAHAQTGWRGGLHYGQSTGKSNEVVGYVRSDGFNSVVHKGINGNIHELFLSGLTWSHGEIAPLANEPIAGKLTAYRRADGTNVVVYRSTHGRVIEVALTGSGWVPADLTNWGGNTAAGDPVGYVRADGVSAVVFRSADGHINELRHGTQAWIPTDLTVASNGTGNLASSDPTPFIRADGLSSVVYRSGSTIIELFKAPRSPWAIGGPASLAVPANGGTGSAPAAAVGSRPYGFTHRNGVAAILYRSTANRMIELRLEGSWKFEDITSSGQLVGGDPVAHVRSDAIDAVYYRSTSNEMHELTRAPLAAWNLSAMYGVTGMTTDPSVFIRNDETDHVLYGLPSNRVGTLMYDVGFGWSQTNLTFSAGETP